MITEAMPPNRKLEAEPQETKSIFVRKAVGFPHLRRQRRRLASQAPKRWPFHHNESSALDKVSVHQHPADRDCVAGQKTSGLRHRKESESTNKLIHPVFSIDNGRIGPPSTNKTTVPRIGSKPAIIRIGV